MEIIRSFWMALKAAVSPLTAFLTGTTLVCCGYASLNSTFALQLNLSDTPMFVSGLVLACYYLGSITASLSAYKFINKVGNIRAFGLYLPALGSGPAARFYRQPVFVAVSAFRRRILHRHHQPVSGKLA